MKLILQRVKNFSVGYIVVGLLWLHAVMPFHIPYLRISPILPLIILAFILKVLQMILNKDRGEVKFITLLGLYFVINLVSIIVNLDNYDSSGEALLAIKPIAGSIILAFLAATCITKRHLKNLVYGMLLILFFASILGIYQFCTRHGYIGSSLFEGESKAGAFYFASGFATTPMVFGIQLVIFTLLGLPLMQQVQNTKKRFVPAFLTFLFAISLALTLSRSPWIALAIGLLIFSYKSRSVRKSLHGIIPMVIAFTMTVILIKTGVLEYGAAIQKGQTPVKERLAVDASAISRLDFLTESLRIIKGNPLFGVGPGNSPDFISKELFERFGLPRTGLHNTFSTITAESGIAGLIPVLLMIYWGARNTTDTELLSKNNISSGITAACAAVISISFFHDLSTDKYFWMVIGLMWSTIKDENTSCHNYA